MKLVGVDYGRRRIGIAVTDDSGVFIRGLDTIDRRRYPDAIEAVTAVIAREHPAEIIMGLPLNIDDGETAMSSEVRRFAESLGGATGLPLRFVDESLTSRRAAEAMRFKKKKQRRDKAAVDRIAACMILEEYLRERSAAVTEPPHAGSIP